MAEPPDIALGLLSSAGEDAQAVGLMIEAAVAPRIIGFHAQQSAEKALKAVLAWSTGGYPKTHDLERLGALVKEAGIELPIALDDLARLTPWAVDRRYPDPFDPEPLDAGWALNVIDAVQMWAAKIVRGSDAT